MTTVVIITASAASMIVVTRCSDDPRAENHQAAIRVPAHSLDNDPAVGIANPPLEYPVALTIEPVLE
jgi:hypothetical protein